MKMLPERSIPSRLEELEESNLTTSVEMGELPEIQPEPVATVMSMQRQTAEEGLISELRPASLIVRKCSGG